MNFLLFSDDGETAEGYVSSIHFVDRPMKMEEVQALGGPHNGGALTPGDPAPALTQQMPRRVGVIGHRGGFFCCAPDNTLAAVRRAISNNVPVIEIDTRLSADGVCVLLHDSTVDRTTDGTGAAVSMTVAQLKTLDAGSWFSPEFAGERIPTLAEVMAEAKGKLILYFDLKVPGQITGITNAVAQTGFNADDCWFWVYNSTTDAASIRSRLPNAKIVWEAPGTWVSDPNFFTTMRSIGVYGFDQGTYYGTINPAFVRAAKEQGFFVAVAHDVRHDRRHRRAAHGGPGRHLHARARVHRAEQWLPAHVQRQRPQRQRRLHQPVHLRRRCPDPRQPELDRALQHTTGELQRRRLVRGSGRLDGHRRVGLLAHRPGHAEHLVSARLGRRPGCQRRPVLPQWHPSLPDLGHRADRWTLFPLLEQRSRPRPAALQRRRHQRRVYP